MLLHVWVSNPVGGTLPWSLHIKVPLLGFPYFAANLNFVCGSLFLILVGAPVFADVCRIVPIVLVISNTFWLLPMAIHIEHLASTVCTLDFGPPEFLHRDEQFYDVACSYFNMGPLEALAAPFRLLMHHEYK